MSAGRVVNIKAGAAKGLHQPVGLDRRQAAHYAAADILMRSVSGVPGAS
jgi:hypothetical protein